MVLAADHPAKAVTADAALARLKEGNARFVSEASRSKPTAATRAALANGQTPFAIVVGCADSRTSPELLFDQNLGDLFVIRTAGNLAGEHTLGSIEYAVEHLGVRLVVVLGHERCGAVKAAVDSVMPAEPHGEKAHEAKGPPNHVGSLVRDILPSVKATAGKPGDRYDAAAAENARQTALKIKRQAVFGNLAGDVLVVSGVYDLDTGEVEWEELKNLALNREATQSSLYNKDPSYGAARAVDGNTSGKWDLAKNEITHTEDGPDNWWQVDLGKSCEISKIVVWNRSDMCQERLANFYIVVSEAPIQSSSTSAGLFAGPLSLTDTQRLHMDITGKKKGRYVRLFLKDSKEPLSLAEVQVFGRE